MLRTFSPTPDGSGENEKDNGNIDRLLIRKPTAFMECTVDWNL